jgi:hypothetical protein
MLSQWDGSTWSQPLVIADIPYPLIKYSVVYTETEGHIVMSLDTKQDEKICTGDPSVSCTTSDDCDAVGGECVDSGSVEDHELFVISSYNGSDWSDLTQLTFDEVQDQNPQLAVDPSGDIILVWVRGDSLASIKNFDMNTVVTFMEAEYISNLMDFKLTSSADGKIAVVWTETAENEAFPDDPDSEERFNDSDIFAIFYDPIFDKWGGPQQLTSDEETETYLAAAFYGDDKIIVVYDRTKRNYQNVARLTPSGRTIALSIPQPPVNTDLFMLEHPIKNDLAIQPYSLYHDPLNPRIGQDVNLRVTIMNKGDKPVTSIPVVFYNGDPLTGGPEIARETVSDILKTGDTYDVSLTWKIPETTSTIEIYAIIDPDGTIQDRDRTNNIDSMHLAMPDLSIYRSSWEKIGDSLYSVTARVRNNGPLAAGETTLKFRKDNPDPERDPLQINNIPSLGPYHTYDLNLTYHTEGQVLENLIIYVTLDEEKSVEEFNEDNNVERIVIVRDTVAPVIQLPDDIVVEATSPDGAKVEYEVTAEDDVDGPVDVRCNPPSGTIFPEGTYEVQCTAFDSSGNRTDGIFNITVEVDTAPVAVDDIATIAEDDPATTIDVLANDTDVDGGLKSIDSVTQPANGTVTITSDGADLTYNPNPDYCNNGTPTDTFTYTLTPGGSVGNVFVTVTCVNDPPLFVKGPDQTVDEDAGEQTVPDWATNISAGPDNESAQTVSFTVSNDNSLLFSAPPSLDANGALTYTPALNAYGSAAVTVQLKDDGGTANGGNDISDPQIFSITVNPIDDPPVAVDDYPTVTEDDTATTIDVLANDTDVDGGLKSIDSVTQPANGTVTITNGGVTYQPVTDYCNDETVTDTFTYTLTPGGSVGNVFVTVNCVNDPPEVDPCIPDSQTVQYSDLIEPVTITASDIDSESLSISVTSLPDGLNFTGGCDPINGGSSCQWTLEGQVLSGAGTFDMTMTVSDGELQADTPATIVIKAENASAAFHDDNDVAIEVDSPGGDSGAFTLAVLVSETRPDAPADMADYGDIGLAEVSMTLAAVGPGGSYTVMCTPVGVTGTGYDAILTVRCDFNDVVVNTYHVQATVVGNYYTGYAENVLIVYDPSLGFTTGGGWFYWPGTGDKTNFGYTMKYNKKGTNIQGSLLLIRHLPDGTIYRVKSNALYGLAIGEANNGEGYGWASFSGKSTYLEPGWPEPVGNHEFVAYVEDRSEPGKDADKFWIQVFDKDHNVINDMSLSIPAIDNTEVLQGGNIVVPHTR